MIAITNSLFFVVMRQQIIPPLHTIVTNLVRKFNIALVGE